MRATHHLTLPCILLLCLNALAGISPALAQSTAPNEWTWMGGSNTGAENQVTGTLGTPAPGNIPAVRYQATSWTDKNGNFWLFGGSNVGDTEDQQRNDLWEFNPSTREWTWMAGSSTGSPQGVYGTLGTPSPQNTPGAREDASSWTDSNGNLWLFGGYGLDANGALQYLNDLWKFNPSTRQWTWMSGSSTVASSCFQDANGGTECALPSVYGTLGTPASGNTPGSRDSAITWTDNQGNLWLFGGWSYDVSKGSRYYFNELWKYNPSTNQWAWMGGSNTRDGSACLQNTNLWFLVCGEPGVYGTVGAPAPGNIPGGRAGAAKWVDSEGNLWLFSGSGFDDTGYFGDPNDVWKLNPSTVQWTWMGGNEAISPCADYDCSGPVVYGTLGTPSPENIPQGRDHGVGWTDRNGNLWLFGGGGGEIPDSILNLGRNDLWKFNPSTSEWALMGGNIESVCGGYCGSSPVAVYGALGVPAPGDGPGSRFAPSAWSDSNGNFWLFGGHLPLVQAASVYGNDLWEYQPSTGPLPTTATPTFSVPAGSYPSAQSVSISDATNGSYIYYTTDGSTPTVDSTVFIPANKTPISIPHSQTLKAIAVASGCLTSAVATAVYTLPPQAATPTFSLPAGTYTSFQTVTISDATPGATIHYTRDASAPTTSSPVYSGPISIVNPYTPLQAIAIASGYSASNVGSAAYTLNLQYVAEPIFTPEPGTYNTPQAVTISDSTPGATIRYQINTDYPTTASPVYTSPITVSSTEVIYAQATAKNYFPSSYSGGEYVINPLAPQAATPAFSLAAGTYTGPQTVTISDTTPGAAIYYTTDGSTPTMRSTVYPGYLTVSSSETLQAIAVLTGYVRSAVASTAYTINQPPGFSITGTAINVSPGATTGNTSAIILTPSGGFTGAISLSCAITPPAASDPPTCSIPATVTISGSTAQTVTVTVNTTAATSGLYRSKSFFELSLGGASLACIVLIAVPPGRRSRWSALGMVLLFFCIAGSALGCGGTGNSGAGVVGGGGGTGRQTGGSPGTTPGAYTLTVTGTSGTIIQTESISLTVQ